MGACMSSGPIEVSEEDKRLHREAEKQLKEVCRVSYPPGNVTHVNFLRIQAKAKMAHQVKVRANDSWKPTDAY